MSELPRTVEVKVRVSRELLEQLSDPETTRLRDDDGSVVTVTLGEPDADGFYEPIMTRCGGVVRRPVTVFSSPLDTGGRALTEAELNEAFANLRESLFGEVNGRRA